MFLIVFSSVFFFITNVIFSPSPYIRMSLAFIYKIRAEPFIHHFYLIEVQTFLVCFVCLLSCIFAWMWITPL